ncbi:MAG: hypothetical protein R2724_16925 [Bryobacterales bacterium]
MRRSTDLRRLPESSADVHPGVPGVLAYALYRDQIGADADQALPFLIQHLVPTGLRGLITAGLLAALMSTIAAALNSCATLVAVDIVARIRPGTTDREQVQIGRWAAIVIMLLAIAWSTQGEKFTGIRRSAADRRGACASDHGGIRHGRLLQARRFQSSVVDADDRPRVRRLGLLVDTPLVGTPPTRPLLADTRLLTDGLGIPFLRQAFFQTMICMAIFLVIAKMTPPPPKEKIEGLTWDNLLQIFTRKYEGAGIDPRHAAAALVVTMLSPYTVFR